MFSSHTRTHVTYAKSKERTFPEKKSNNNFHLNNLYQKASCLNKTS